MRESESSSQTAIARAQLLAGDLGRPREALRLIEEAIPSDPQNPQLWVMRAWVYQQLREWRLSVEAAKVAVQHAPENEWAFRIMSTGHRRLNNYSAAVANAREAVRLAPHNAYTHATLGQAQSMRMWTWRQGGQAIDRALQIAPNDPAVLSSAGTAMLARRRPKQAQHYFQQALAIRPDDAAIRNDLALAHGRRLRFRQAILGYTDALATKPSQQLSYVNITATVWKIALVTYPLVLGCALFAANVNPRVPLILPFVGLAAWELRGNTWRLLKVVVPAVERKGGALPLLTIGMVVAVGWMLAIPLFPTQTGRSEAHLLAILDAYPALLVCIGFIRTKLR